MINSDEDLQNAFAIQHALGTKSITLSVEPNLRSNVKESFFNEKRPNNGTDVTRDTFETNRPAPDHLSSDPLFSNLLDFDFQMVLTVV